eukprot:CAMPEP_0197045194 /NCGR_PEP_ID=MMETSP1384-20130603/21107_1 /TAXON_ID=29189 /ORGANISM="Ammonia sp." /LENGTH=63 /DNA_ID=CAMNT_0042476767 /DNA_START=33 /DNA_END=224 /DNA_ORIENTATION=+
MTDKGNHRNAMHRNSIDLPQRAQEIHAAFQPECSLNVCLAACVHIAVIAGCVDLAVANITGAL